MHSEQHPSAPKNVVVAHPNIALIKYWGKRPGAGNLPAVGSLSVTLDTFCSRTRVTLDSNLSADTLILDGLQAAAHETVRVQQFLAGVRALADDAQLPFCRVETSNNFPTGAGLASSASGFAALTLAACNSYGIKLTQERLSGLARSGSGSAARSIFGGFVEMSRGDKADGTDSVARPLLAREAWPLCVVVAITRKEAKTIGSSLGMERSRSTSPFWDGWVSQQERDLDVARAAVRAQDFKTLAEVSEHSCFKMHALALSARPKIFYWLPSTVAALHAVAKMRQDGVDVFATMDAGPQVKAVCMPHVKEFVANALRRVPGVLEVKVLGLGEGAQVCAEES